MSNAQETTPSIDVGDFIKQSPYVPRQLILAVTDVRQYGILPEGAAESHSAFVTLMEKYILRTKIRSTEGPNGAMVDGVQNVYTQEFVAHERYGKVVQFLLRTLRERATVVELLMIEPDVTYTKVVDAWLLSEAKIGAIRSNSTPTRDLENVVKSDDGDNVRVTFELKGKLSYKLAVREMAQPIFEQLAKTGEVKPKPSE